MLEHISTGMDPILLFAQNSFMSLIILPFCLSNWLDKIGKKKKNWTF
jgi:hypothetical protein